MLPQARTLFLLSSLPKESRLGNASSPSKSERSGDGSRGGLGAGGGLFMTAGGLALRHSALQLRADMCVKHLKLPVFSRVKGVEGVAALDLIT